MGGLPLRHLESAGWPPGRQVCLMALSLFSFKTDLNDACRHPHMALPDNPQSLGLGGAHWDISCHPD